LRASGLAGRFLLAILLARYFELSDIGAFGLLVAVIAVSPAALGFGLNYYLNRELVDAPIAEAAHKIRDRLGLSAVIAIMVVAASMAAIEANVVSGPHYLIKFGAITVLEIIAFDVHMALIALRMPIVANVVVFVRTAAWTFPFVCLAYLFPHFRTMDALLDCWLVGLIGAFAVLFVRLRSWPWREVLRRPVDVAWYRRHIRTTWLIYLSDIGNAGFQFIDRFLVSVLLGLTLTGVYTFYWTFANAIQLLVQAAVTQVALPRLVAAYRTGDRRLWVSALSTQLYSSVLTGAALCLVVYVGLVVITPHLKRPELLEYPFLLPALLVGTVVRLGSDALNYALYASSHDRQFALSNILAIILSLLTTLILLRAFGLVGAGVSVVVTNLAILTFRGLSLFRWPGVEHPGRARQDAECQPVESV
jgi:O-antigen/teichoic acid export membrane protein